MQHVFRNRQGSLRNGWWILAFLAVFLASQPLYRLISRALKGQGIDGLRLSPLPFVVLLLVTWICLRLRHEPLAAIGLRPDRAWTRELLAGVAVGGGLIVLITGLIVAAGGVEFSVNPARSLEALATGTWLFVWVVMLEELLFRGFVFQRMVDGLGPSAAVGGMAVLFAAAHLGNPGMEGATAVLAIIDLMLGAILLGLAYLKTRRLALPIGIHFGWNWTQGALLGFDVSGLEQAGWLLPELLGQPNWLTGGEFGPEASIFALLVDTAAIVVMWRWKGRVKARPMVHAPAAQAPG